MGKPAARLGDMTVHGGSIVVGCPTVLIGGMPAARVGDNHVCPMLNPGTPPPPHVGGPIMPPGVPTVLIGGAPAACVGDMVTCAGPPDTIAPPGCPTVMIAPGGGGGGGGGAASAGGGEAEADAAAVEIPEPHFLHVKFVDNAGFPITGVQYTIKDPEGKSSSGDLIDGLIKRQGVPEGEHEIELKAIIKAEWSKRQARDGETVKMLVETAGIEDGTEAVFEVWSRDLKKPGTLVATMADRQVQGGKLEAEWTFEWVEEEEDASECEHLDGYSSPSFFFTVKVGRCQARSGILSYADFIEVFLKDQAGNPVGNTAYRVYLANGEVRGGKLDSNGYAKIDKVPPGKWSVQFPDWGLPDEP